MGFIDNFSMHGAPHVVPWRLQSIFWLAITVTCMIILGFQMHGIISRFVRRDSSVSVHMKFATQTFPAVTFCNLNPIRKEKLDLVPEIKLMLSACDATDADVDRVIKATGYKEPEDDDSHCEELAQKLKAKKSR